MADQPNASIAAALAAAQGQMKNASFDKVNPHFKSKYASLAAILDVIREPLAKNGLAVTQTLEGGANGTLFLITTLRYGAEGINSWYPLPSNVKPQEFGSALTYARRYSLSALLNISADDDDDANIANNSKAKAEEDGEVISKGQRETLEAALAVREMPTDRFLKGIRAHFQLTIPTMDDIPAKHFDSCLKSISKPAKEVAHPLDQDPSWGKAE